MFLILLLIPVYTKIKKALRKLVGKKVMYSSKTYLDMSKNKPVSSDNLFLHAVLKLYN